ncbi:hypothetical protein A2Z23_03275 [Candidatus Curtissbacteria bacterium RBG_16_39_7]|uniref:Type II secretion system protein GspG C-terminal domain-containing protein n=1 Tax=Candidatus Curtissbacteria bacterium RBG_16_39_7 TaxID=1797707 RepID=A0A1F5G4Q1_9BACT|nr:MAG: hypothetical protein A2Z23_03275 [Candidatus Curtissbacteria bacterium RBG_16_39_7]
MGENITALAQKLFDRFFIVQTDPWTSEVSRKRILIAIFLFSLVLGAISLPRYINPANGISKEKRDQQRIDDLDALKNALIAYQNKTGLLPANDPSHRFKIGGVGSHQDPEKNWLGVDLSCCIEKVPVDPYFAMNAGAPYPYRYVTNGFAFKLDTYLEANVDNLMQDDGGILNDDGTPTNNRARYEVGTDLSLGF